VRATRVTPAGEHRVVLAVVPRVFDQRDGHAGVRDKRAADLARPILAAVVHEDDFVTTLDVQTLDVTDDRADGLSRAIERNDEGQRQYGRWHCRP
jgi:hypothetical protein